MTGVFSAANEQAVAMFLEKKIGYFDIYKTIDMAMEDKNDLILDPDHLWTISWRAICGRGKTCWITSLRGS